MIKRLLATITVIGGVAYAIWYAQRRSWFIGFEQGELLALDDWNYRELEY